jgi:integrase
MGCVFRQLNHSKVWIAKFTASDGKQVNRSTRTRDKATAELIMQQFERDAATARIDGELTVAAINRNAAEMHKRITGKALNFVTARTYTEEYLKSKEAKATQATMRSYGKIVRFFLKFLDTKADQDIQRIKPVDVQGFIGSRIKGGAAPATVKLDIKVLNSVFLRAMKQGICVLNPAATVDMPVVDSDPKLPFSLSEAQAILKACPDDEWRTLIYLGFYTGGRIRDISDLTWASLDLGKNPAVAYRQRKIRKGAQSKVQITMHPNLKDWLEEYRMNQRHPKPSDPVLPNIHKLKPGGRAGNSQQFISIMRKAGIDPCYAEGKHKLPKKSFHSFRHTMVTMLQGQDVPEEVRMLIVGHSNPDVHKIYGHDNEAAIKSAINKLPKLTA